jgi:6-phosphofructokinase 1
MVVEVMGRDTGWVAVVGGLAGGADMIIIPEFPISFDDVIAHLHRRRGEGRDFSIIVIAEGAHVEGLDLAAVGLEQAKDAFGHVQLAKRALGESLSARLEAATGFETRATVLGHLQRGGSPSPIDRIWATRLGVAAADLIAEGKSGVAPIRRNGEVEVAPLAELVREQRRVPRELYELSTVFG